MNFDQYPWLSDLSSPEAIAEIQRARDAFKKVGAVLFPNFLAPEALRVCVSDAKAKEANAFTTDDFHTAYLKPTDYVNFPNNSVYNYQMNTKVASTAFDELSPDSPLVKLYQHPTLLELVSLIVQKKLYLSEDPLGCCSINIFRPGYHHSFHFDESEFSTTIMLQESEAPGTGLFQYTDPVRGCFDERVVLQQTAGIIQAYDQSATNFAFAELDEPPADTRTTTTTTSANKLQLPALHTLEFHPGTLFIFSGSQSLHRVTRVEGSCSRLVAVLTFATQPGFCNSAAVQEMFWGRSSSCYYSSSQQAS